MSDQEAIARRLSGPDGQVQIIQPGGPEDALRAVLSGDLTKSFVAERDRVTSSQSEEVNLRSIAMQAKRHAKMFNLNRQKDCDEYAELQQASALGTCIIRIQRPLVDGIKLGIFIEWLELQKPIEEVRADTTEAGERLLANIKARRKPARAAAAITPEPALPTPKHRERRIPKRRIVELDDMPPTHQGTDGKAGST